MRTRLGRLKFVMTDISGGALLHVPHRQAVTDCWYTFDFCVSYCQVSSDFWCHFLIPDIFQIIFLIILCPYLVCAVCYNNTLVLILYIVVCRLLLVYFCLDFASLCLIISCPWLWTLVVLGHDILSARIMLKKAERGRG